MQIQEMIKGLAGYSTFKESLDAFPDARYALEANDQARFLEEVNKHIKLQVALSELFSASTTEEEPDTLVFEEWFAQRVVGGCRLRAGPK